MKNKIVVIFLIILSIGISFYIYPKIFKKEKVEELVIIKPEDISSNSNIIKNIIKHIINIEKHLEIFRNYIDLIFDT